MHAFLVPNVSHEQIVADPWQTVRVKFSLKLIVMMLGNCETFFFAVDQGNLSLPSLVWPMHLGTWHQLPNIKQESASFCMKHVFANQQEENKHFKVKHLWIQKKMMSCESCVSFHAVIPLRHCFRAHGWYHACGNWLGRGASEHPIVETLRI